MQYKKFDNTYVVRIDRGEEIISAVRSFALAENIKLASISALGAVDEFTVGVYDLAEQKFIPNEFSGCFEIVSLTGTINTMDGKFYTHMHMSAADKNGHVFGGHLSCAHISVTCEMIVTVINGCVDRFRDSQTGINLLKL